MTKRSEKLEELIARARGTTMPAADQEAQRRSFAYGNTKIENDRITKQTVDDAAERLASGED
jgi:hypothetical protein